MVFPTTVSVRLKCGRLSVAAPVTMKTTVAELKAIFIDATASSLETIRDSGAIEGLDPDQDIAADSIKLFKQSEDEEGREKWIPLDDKKNVDLAGLDQGHVVGVSFSQNGLFSDPVIEQTLVEEA